MADKDKKELERFVQGGEGISMSYIPPEQRKRIEERKRKRDQDKKDKE